MTQRRADVFRVNQLLFWRMTMATHFRTMSKGNQVTTQMAKLDALVTQRVNWQSEYNRTNESLYNTLGDCLALYSGIKGKSIERHVLSAIKTKLEERTKKVYKNTSVLMSIVRYVFDAKPQRSSIYARALAIAVDARVTPQHFPKWVSDFGGIEEVVSIRSKNPQAERKQMILTEKVNVVWDMLNVQLENPLTIVPATDLVRPADTGEYTLFIGKMKADGASHILSAVPSSDAMVDNAINCIARKLIEDEQYAPITITTMQQGRESQSIAKPFHYISVEELVCQDESEFA
ncbi:MAG: hypothetical protein RL755_2195 [Pseudomonadota bacterium]